ncbi:MAG TPA: EAL domain-containing protein [Steroidobacteraceae bacterium]|nr:EAL domain-containing protein [Steroidobacteraceae bacterium]
MAESMGTAILNIGTSVSLTQFIKEALAAERDGRFDFFTAASDTEAIQASRSRRFALIVTGPERDALPHPAGIRSLRAANPDVPILVMADDVATGKQSLDAGADGYCLTAALDRTRFMEAVRTTSRPTSSADYIEQQMAKVVLNAIGDAVIGTDSQGRVTYINKVAERLLGREASSICGTDFAGTCRIYDIQTKDYLPSLMSLVGEGQSAAQAMRGSVLISPLGTEIPIEHTVSPLYDRGALAGAVIVFRDLSESRAMTERMSYLAHHDFLTDLPNRVLLSNRLSQCIILAERHDRLLSILFLDLDGFKLINDSLGHSIGDELLKEVARRLTLCVRRSDTVSRQGGDEFVVLLAEVANAQDAAVTAEKMRVALSAPYFISSHQLHLRCSIGISVYPDDGRDAETLIKSADMAMYHAKESGRNRIQFFENEMNVRVVRRQSMIQAMSEALTREEFVLHYQPTYNLHTSEAKGVEALIRWQRPAHGLIAPGHFISIAEDAGLIEAIGQWVLHQACYQARAWIDEGLSVDRVSVNISALEFNCKTFSDSVRNVLKNTGLDPWRLELELTETAVMRDVIATSHVLAELSADGVRFAMDDFGTGYSSLNHLLLFPIDTLKIDKSFVQDVRSNANAATIVTAIVQLGQSLEMEVIAEGIETAEQLRFLAMRGCLAGQGYYFGPPVGADEVRKHLQPRRAGHGRAIQR